MLDVRANIVSGAATALAKACAITTRYSLSRKQGYALGEPQSDGEKEVEVGMEMFGAWDVMILGDVRWCVIDAGDGWW
jgi:hypothetical protein